jgi:hypothetical protein
MTANASTLAFRSNLIQDSSSRNAFEVDVEIQRDVRVATTDEDGNVRALPLRPCDESKPLQPDVVEQWRINPP